MLPVLSSPYLLYLLAHKVHDTYKPAQGSCGACFGQALRLCCRCVYLLALFQESTKQAQELANERAAKEKFRRELESTMVLYWSPSNLHLSYPKAIVRAERHAQHNRDDALNGIPQSIVRRVRNRPCSSILLLQATLEETSAELDAARRTIAEQTATLAKREETIRQLQAAGT